jgi:isocitrate/isopropylmalate dehydrogenase
MQGLAPYQGVASNTPTMGATQDIARKQVESAMGQIRSANQLLDGLATQFPAAAQEVDACKKALVKVTVKIVGSQSQSETPQTPTGVMG